MGGSSIYVAGFTINRCLACPGVVVGLEGGLGVVGVRGVCVGWLDEIAGEMGGGEGEYTS